MIWLRDITSIERTELKQYCLVIETTDRYKLSLSLKSDAELYEWQEDIYSRSPLNSSSNPTNFMHNIHAGFDPITGELQVSFVPFSYCIGCT